MNRDPFIAAFEAAEGPLIFLSAAHPLVLLTNPNLVFCSKTKIGGTLGPSDLIGVVKFYVQPQ
jgi:hypothetical protein